MAFYHRIPVWYFRWIPAIYFAVFGTQVIVSALFAHTADWTLILIAFAFLPPLFFKNRIIHIVCSIPLAVVSGLFSCIFTSALIIGYDEGESTRTPGMFLATLTAIFTFVCALALLYAGTSERAHRSK